nr:hypothetical protein [Tanacetum cinerariifolium]
MEHSNTTHAKIPILDTRKFEQWKYRIHQYLQNEHYALWEVIKFRDSYEVSKESAATGSSSDGKKGRTIAITTKDMQKRRNDVKVRTTLLLVLPDEHQLRFSKYKTAQELWAAILKTFGGNKATRKTKKNLLKQQYGNFKAEGKETLEQTFNKLQAIRNRSDLDTMSQDDLYNHLKVYELEVQKKLDSHNMAFISSSKNSSGNEEDNTASIPTASTQVSPASPTVAPANSPTVVKINKNETVRKPTIKYTELYRKTPKRSTVRDHGRSWAKNNNTHKSRTPITVFHKTGRPPMRTNRPYMNAAQPKRTSFYKPAHSYLNRPFQRTSAVRSQFRGLRVPTVNRNFPTVNRKFPTGNSRFSTTDVGNKGKAGDSQINIDDKGYWDSGCSRHMTGNISYLSDYEPYDGGYVSFGQGGCKITGKGTIKTGLDKMLPVDSSFSEAEELLF